MRVAAFSSSRTGNSAYLEKVVPAVVQFLGTEKMNIAFVPYASVNEYDKYLQMVTTAFAGTPYQFVLAGEHNAKAVIESADAVMVGGGNTFKLLHNLYTYDVVKLIKQKVKSGTPYIGWSAGANLTGATICTTNDMPIIEPASFTSFGFLPFQVNPHYINEVREGHNGETRDQRLTEYVKLNANMPVVAIPEGTYLLLDDGKLTYHGEGEGFIFSFENEMQKQAILPSADLTYLMEK